MPKSWSKMFSSISSFFTQKETHKDKADHHGFFEDDYISMLHYIDLSPPFELFRFLKEKEVTFFSENWESRRRRADYGCGIDCHANGIFRFNYVPLGNSGRGWLNSISGLCNGGYADMDDKLMDVRHFGFSYSEETKTGKIFFTNRQIGSIDKVGGYGIYQFFSLGLFDSLLFTFTLDNTGNYKVWNRENKVVMDVRQVSRRLALTYILRFPENVSITDKILLVFIAYTMHYTCVVYGKVDGEEMCPFDMDLTKRLHSVGLL